MSRYAAALQGLYCVLFTLSQAGGAQGGSQGLREEQSVALEAQSSQEGGCYDDLHDEKEVHSLTRQYCAPLGNGQDKCLPCLHHKQAHACAAQNLPKPNRLHLSLRADRPVTAGSHTTMLAARSAPDSTGHSQPKRQKADMKVHHPSAGCR
jgi:hypothetical protein